MKLIQEVQKPNSDIRVYVDTLSSILEHKIEMITSLKSRIDDFSVHLDEEEQLSNKFKKEQAMEKNKHEGQRNHYDHYNRHDDD